jgi:pimeloyl-ACP methyl ester carboxylesterase
VSIARKTSRDFQEEAKSIRAPLLYLYGEESAFTDILLQPNIKFLQTYLPQAQTVGLEGGVHDLAVQMPGEVAGLILEFFGRDR